MGDRVELTAAALEDPRLESRLRSQPPDARRALLAEADRLRTGSEAQQRLAYVAYRTLQDDVDPAQPAGASRAAWVLLRLQQSDDRWAPFVRRAADCCAHDETRLRALALCAGKADRDGDLTEAGRMFAAVADAPGDVAPELRLEAVLHAAHAAAVREDCRSALSWTLRALATGPSRLGARSEALVHRVRAEIFASMRDPGRTERELLLAESRAPHLADSEARALRSEIAAVRGTMALRQGLSERAAGLLEQSLVDLGASEIERRRRTHLAFAGALLDLRRADRAAAHLARAMKLAGGGRACVDVEQDWVRIRIQRAAGGPLGAVSSARALLARVETELRPVLGPLRRARLAADLARILVDASAPRDEQGAAWDLAATTAVEAAVLARLSIPADGDECGIGDDDVMALRDHSARALAAFVALQWHVARFIGTAIAEHGADALAPAAPDDERIVACPWCALVQRGHAADGTGSWDTIATLTEGDVRRGVRHAPCEDCAEVLLGTPAA